MSGEIRLAASGLTKSFRIPVTPPKDARLASLPLRRRYRELRVLDDVSFDVHDGEIFGIVGRNGAGKSTLLRLLANIYEPDAGTVSVRGEVISIAALSSGFHPRLSVRDNVIMKGIMLGLPRDVIKARFEKIIDYAEINGFEQVELRKLSSGMKGRLAFSIAMEMDPDIVLLDEVLSAGDAAFKDKVGNLLAEFQRRGKTIVIVSHSTGEIERTCDAAIWLDGGRVEASGDPKEVVGRYLEKLQLKGSPQQVDGDDTQPRQPGLALSPLTDGSEKSRARIGELKIDAGGADGFPAGDSETPIEIEGQIEITSTIGAPKLGLELCNEEGRGIFAPPLIPLRAQGDGPLKPGETPKLEVAIENVLAPGRYTLSCAIIHTTRKGRDRPVSAPRSVEFALLGTPNGSQGAVELRHRANLKRGARAAA